MEPRPSVNDWGGDVVAGGFCGLVTIPSDYVVGLWSNFSSIPDQVRESERLSKSGDYRGLIIHSSKVVYNQVASVWGMPSTDSWKAYAWAATEPGEVVETFSDLSPFDKAFLITNTGGKTALAVYPLLKGGAVGVRTSLQETSSTGPKPSPKFEAPTIPPQLPPSSLPPGYRIWRGRPTEQYPHGYWKMLKDMGPGSKGQRIDPSTMKPGSHRETHVEFPPDYEGPFDN